MPSTDERVAWAAHALAAHIRARGDVEDDEADFRDLLTDLMHYAKARGINFQDELSTASDHFEEERIEVARHGHKFYCVCLISGLPITMTGIVELPEKAQIPKSVLTSWSAC